MSKLRHITRCRIVALCSDVLTQCNHGQVNEAMHADRCMVHGPDIDGEAFVLP
jgi:hypothetical protein